MGAFLGRVMPCFTTAARDRREDQRVRSSMFNSQPIQIRVRNLAARYARVVSQPFALKSEGAGNAGRSMHPQPRVQNKKAHEHSHHGHTGFTRHSPRNGFTAYFALSPVTRLV